MHSIWSFSILRMLREFSTVRVLSLHCVKYAVCFLLTALFHVVIFSLVYRLTEDAGFSFDGLKDMTTYC